MGKQADEAEEGIEFGNPLADNSDEMSSSDSDEDLWTRDQRRRAAAKAAKAEAEADVTARAVTPVAKQAGDQAQGREIALLAPEPEREPQPESLSASDVFEHEQAEEKLRQKAKKDAQKNAKLQERSEEKERKQAEREEKAVHRAKPTKLQQLKPTGAFETDLKPGMSKIGESWDGVSSDDGSQDEEGEKGNLEVRLPSIMVVEICSQWRPNVGYGTFQGVGRDRHWLPEPERSSRAAAVAGERKRRRGSGWAAHRNVGAG